MTIRLLYLLAVILPFTGALYAQNKSWIGTTDEWGLPENWNPNGVPTSENDVTISSGTAWPKLSGPVGVKSFTMNPGSQIDMKGHKLTSEGVIYLTGATVFSSQTGPAAMETKGGTSYLRNSVFTNGLDFKATGSAVLNEADAIGANTYSGNLKITMAGSGTLNFSSGYRSVVNGNLVIERPADATGGATNIFTSGAAASTGVTGDFTYINKIGGTTTIGGSSGKTVVAGKVNMDVETTGNPAFILQSLANITPGGAVSIINPGLFNLYNDTLTVASFTVSGKKFNDTNISNNRLTFGSFQYEDDPVNNAALYLSLNEFTGTTTFTHKGTGGFNEGWNGANTYNGNTVFMATGGVLNISGWSKSTFNGNLTVERTVAGPTNVFTGGGAGSVMVTGDFNYRNHAGGETQIGSTVGGKNVVEGKVNIDAEAATGNPAFMLRRLANQTTGGTISILNPGALNIQNDTLTVASFTVSGKKFSDTNISDSKLTFDTFQYEDDPLNNAALYLSSNEFNGVTVFTHKGTGGFNEGWNGPNTFNGNTTFTATGGTLTVSGWSKSTFNGNLTVERTATGTTNVFTSGNTASVMVTGDFFYKSHVGGETQIGSTVGNKNVVEGKVNIDVDATGNPTFILRRLTNHTTGGTISILNPGALYIQNDTLTVAGFTVSGKKFSDTNISDSKLAFDSFQYEDDPLNNAALYLSSNEFNGVTAFTHKGTGGFNEGWNGPNTYNGNTTFTARGGTLNVSGWSKSTFNGNLTVKRTLAGPTNLFTGGGAGSVMVTGDFSYQNHTGGDTQIGAGTGDKNVVEGKVDIDVETIANPGFILQKLTNHTTGGVVSILNPGPLNIQSDTLTLAGFVVRGKKSGDSYFSDSRLTFGTFQYEDDPLNNGSLYLSSGEFNGTTAFTNKGSGAFNEGWNGPNQFNGNVTYTRQGTGPISIGHTYVSSYARDLVFASAAGIVVNAPGRVRFNGATDGTFTQTGVTEPVLPGFILEKTDAAKLVLSQPLRTSHTVSFVSGYIQASETNPLIFQAGTGHTGASDESHVLGPVHKIGNTEFIFPTGSGEKLFTAGISAPADPADRFSAEFLARNPADDGYDPALKAGTLTKVFNEGYWEIRPVAPAVGNVTITLGYNVPSGYITNPLKMAVAHWSGGQWNDLGNGGTSGSNVTGTVSTAGAVAAFSPFTIASTEDVNPLPVVLAGFSVAKEGTSAVLQWATTAETNSERFEIEHSADARIWRMIGAIPAKKEHNNISGYTYIHTTLSAGINYYRLKMIDTDGSYSYSMVRSVRSGGIVNVYPNPVAHRLFVAAGEELPKAAIVEFFAANGIPVRLNGDLTHGFDVSGLPAGIYFLRIRNNDGGWSGNYKFLISRK